MKYFQELDCDEMQKCLCPVPECPVIYLCFLYVAVYCKQITGMGEKSQTAAAGAAFEPADKDTTQT